MTSISCPSQTLCLSPSILDQHLSLASEQVMHLASWRHCEARNIPSTIALHTSEVRAGFGPKRLQLDCPKSRCESYRTTSHTRHPACAALYHPSHSGSGKAGRGQVGYSYCHSIVPCAHCAYRMCVCSSVYDAVSPTATMKGLTLMQTIRQLQACAWHLAQRMLPKSYKDNSLTTPKRLMHCKRLNPVRCAAVLLRVSPHPSVAGISCTHSHA